MFQNQSFPRPWHQIPQYTTSPVIVSHSGAPSPTSTSHVKDGSTFSTNYVNNLHPTSANYVRGTILFTPNHSHVTYPTSIHNIVEDSLTSANHDESMSPVVVNNDGGIERPRCLRRNPKFLCSNCDGIHLTRLCPNTVEIP
jgi:hypothetical protein